MVVGLERRALQTGAARRVPQEEAQLEARLARLEEAPFRPLARRGAGVYGPGRRASSLGGALGAATAALTTARRAVRRRPSLCQVVLALYWRETTPSWHWEKVQAGASRVYSVQG